MSMLVLTDDNFYHTIADHEGYLLVDFWAEWCGPCKKMEPVLNDIDTFVVPVGKVNVDENSNIVEAFKISSIPTMILFFEGKPVKRITGAKSYAELLSDLKRFL